MLCVKFLFSDSDDFDTTVFTVVYPADEGQDSITQIDAFIPVMDDDIDENEEQTFIVFFEVINATNIDLIVETEESRSHAVCRIIDDDRKFT